MFTPSQIPFCMPIFLFLYISNPPLTLSYKYAKHLFASIALAPPYKQQTPRPSVPLARVLFSLLVYQFF